MEHASGEHSRRDTNLTIENCFIKNIVLLFLQPAFVVAVVY